jgi:hypothetical protein
VNACAGKEEKNCSQNDKGVKNQHGVWFIPSRWQQNPPGEFWNMKCAPRGGRIQIFDC